MTSSNHLSKSGNLHYVRASDSDFEKQQIVPVLAALSAQIFDTVPDDPHSSPEEWLRRLHLHSQAMIIYVLDKAPCPVPVALLFAFPSGERMHVWIAGVRKDYRKEGLLGQMMGSLEEQCKDALGFILLSICTYPDKFTDMWNWLRKRGWLVERDEGQGKFRLIKPLVR